MSMSWLLPEGARLHFQGLDQPLTILRGLGGGTQGQVYAVEAGGETLALKWYLPACLAGDPGLPRRLRQSIGLGTPNPDFLWPLALLEPTAASRPLIRHPEAGFGYLMALRPPSFLGAHLHAGGQLEISLQNVLRACFFLADGFHQLHLKGLCYKDISLGNLFLEPGSGRILICDNDNVDIDGGDPGSVLGTPGFMAPEVLLRQSRPGAGSDLFSLAVLIFRLLTRHDPFRGRRELTIRCLDEPARRRLYGEEALFIFDPDDAGNRPDPEEHAAALVTWPIYPAALQALFVQTFCTGLRQPQRRALTGQWTQALSRCLDQRQLCPGCGQETFPEPEQEGHCWHCGATLPRAARLQTSHSSVTVTTGNALYPHHFNPLLRLDLHQPIGRLEAHPSDPTLLGLRNLSGEPWQATLNDGRTLRLEPGRTCNLAALQDIRTSAGTLTLLA
jgi:DNA-binding helix-hairpin-helix protein with protein kinase domain